MSSFPALSDVFFSFSVQELANSRTFGDGSLPDFGRLEVEILSSDMERLLSMGSDTSLPVSNDVTDKLSEFNLFFLNSG